MTHDTLMQQLRAAFQVEAGEHLQTLSDGLLALEAGAPKANANDTIERTFRAVHSLKGAARAVESWHIESLCQSMEDVLASWRRSGVGPMPVLLDAMHKAGDAAAALLAGALDPAPAVIAEAHAARRALMKSWAVSGSPGIATTTPVATPRAMQPASEIPIPLSQRPLAWPLLAKGAMSPGVPASRVVAPVPPLPGEAAPRRTSVRVSTAALESQLLQAEEMLGVKLAARERAVELADLTGGLQAWRRGWSDVEMDARLLRETLGGAATAVEPSIARNTVPAGTALNTRLSRVLDFVDDSLAVARRMESSASAVRQAAEQDGYAVARLVDGMLDHVKTLLLQPFATVTASFPKLVRDICQEQDKEVEFVIKGDDVRIEKYILEDIKDPLIHLLRNSVDHGVETRATRQASGKQLRAAISLTMARTESNRVEIMLVDDGGGIDAAAVKAAALRAGVITPAQASTMAETEAYELIFQTAVSSRAAVTRLSGRGLGLAIAREKVEALNGEISVRSTPGQGTSFRIVLPVTRATFRGILVECEGQLLVVPTVQVERVGRTPGRGQNGDSNGHDAIDGINTVKLDGRAVPLIPLARVLALSTTASPDLISERCGTARPYLVIGQDDARVALSVDEIAGEQEVLVKPLRRPLVRVRNIAGVTILGSGRVAPVLDVPDLLRSVRLQPAVARADLAADLLDGKIKTRPPASEPRETAAAKGRRNAAKRTVLVAEDSITARMLFQAILEAAGFDVESAVDGADAREKLNLRHFDLLVSDIEMPIFDGIELTQWVRADARLAALPVVLITTLASDEDRRRGADAGANAYIVKGSLEQGDLIETVHRLLGARP